MSKPSYALELIEDPSVRGALIAVSASVSENLMSSIQGRFVTAEFSSGTFLVPHKLLFVPRDAWFTCVRSDVGSVVACLASVLTSLIAHNYRPLVNSSQHS